MGKAINRRKVLEGLSSTAIVGAPLAATLSATANVDTSVADRICYHLEAIKLALSEQANAEGAQAWSIVAFGAVNPDNHWYNMDTRLGFYENTTDNCKEKHNRRIAAYDLNKEQIKSVNLKQDLVQSWTRF